MISASPSITTARVQLGHYTKNHGEDYTCVDGRVLLGEGGVGEKSKRTGGRGGR